MNDKPEIKPMGITPLKRICMTIGELPSSYLESMTYYEQVLWLTKFLQERMIPALDNNALAVEELQKLFIELQNYVNNYFDNLDVQDEINNKLDKMLEDGVLEQIIEQYLESTALWCFDTVTDMKQATNLIDGSYAKTLGYYEVNDGGGATYKITETESDTEYQEELESGLYANLVTVNNTIYLSQTGLIGDNLTDVTVKLNEFFGYDYQTFIINNGNYVVSANINLTKSNCKIKFENASIRMLPNNKTLYYIFNCYKLHDITFENLHLIGDKDEHLGNEGEWGHCLNITDSYNIKVKNSKFENAWGDGIYIGLEYSKTPTNTVENIEVENCTIKNCSRNGIALCTGNHIKIKDCYIENVKRVNPRAGIDIEPEHSDMSLVYLDNVIIENVTFYDASKCVDVNIHDINTNINILDCKIFGAVYGIHFNGNTTDTKSIFNINNIMMKGINYSGIYLRNNDSNSYYNINDVVIEDCTYSGSPTNSEQSAIRLGLENGDIYNLNLSNVSVKPTNKNFGSAIYIENSESYKLKNSIIKNITSKNAFYVNNIELSSCDISFEKESNTSYYQITSGGSSSTLNKFITPQTSAFDTYRKLNKVPRGFYEFIFLQKGDYSNYVDLTNYTNVYYEGALSTNKKFYCTSQTGKLVAYVNSDTDIYITETIGTWESRA